MGVSFREIPRQLCCGAVDCTEGYQLRKIKFTRHIGFLITEEIFQQIFKITDKREITISQYIREVLEAILNESAGGSTK